MNLRTLFKKILDAAKAVKDAAQSLDISATLSAIQAETAAIKDLWSYVSAAPVTPVPEGASAAPLQVIGDPVAYMQAKVDCAEPDEAQHGLLGGIDWKSFLKNLIAQLVAGGIFG